jgi:predicted acyltransferase
MFVFVAGGLITILTGNLGFHYQGEWISIKSFTYGHLLQPTLGDYPGSLVFALGFVFVCWLIAHYLYKKKIFIKL